MGGTGTNKGSQDIQFKYYDPLKSDHFDKRNQSIISTGIYVGGMLTKVTDASVSVSPLICEIEDGSHQARVQTTVAYACAVAPATPYVVISWDWQSLSAWYMDIKGVAVGAIGVYDLVIGRCLYAGATLTGFEYLLRKAPLTMNSFLKCLPLETPIMKVRCNSGWCSYGTSRINVPAQQSATIVVPAGVGDSRIDLAYIDSGGNLLIKTGVDAVSPVAPDHSDLIVLAEILTTNGQTTIVETDITDSRPFINLGGAGGLAGVDVGLLFLAAY